MVLYFLQQIWKFPQILLICWRKSGKFQPKVEFLTPPGDILCTAKKSLKNFLKNCQNCGKITQNDQEVGDNPQICQIFEEYLQNLDKKVKICGF